jgi:hypothetical protein
MFQTAVTVGLLILLTAANRLCGPSPALLRLDIRYALARGVETVGKAQTSRSLRFHQPSEVLNDLLDTVIAHSLTTGWWGYSFALLIRSIFPR